MIGRPPRSTLFPAPTPFRSSGARTASVSIADDATGSPQTVAVSGTGAAPAVTLSPVSLAFGSQTGATASTAEPETHTNSGTPPLTVNKIALAAANTSDFSPT